MKLDYEYVKVCDALFRIPGTSKGADQEVAWAGELNIPVYHNMEQVKHAIEQHRLQQAVMHL